MMTEAEALKTLAREDPAVADDARTALRSLTSGGGLGAISLLRLQEFLWYGLPAGMPQSAEEHLAVTRALARLFTLAGMERYAEVCAGEETAQIIGAYRNSRAEGIAAYTRALATSHAVPLVNVFRPDVLVPCLDAETVLSQAPAVEQQRFRVPRILAETE